MHPRATGFDEMPLDSTDPPIRPIRLSRKDQFPSTQSGLEREELYGL